MMPMSCRISGGMNGSALDYNIYHTVNVGQFPIRAALVYPPLQPMFENALLDYIDKNTRLQTTDGASDLQIEGEITGYALSPQAVTENAYASMTRLTITVRVKYTDNKQEGKDIDLGGIAKGYCADRVVNILKNSGITSAVLSLGGMLLSMI